MFGSIKNTLLRNCNGLLWRMETNAYIHVNSGRDGWVWALIQLDRLEEQLPNQDVARRKHWILANEGKKPTGKQG
jgi:hypothetical protein